MGGEFDVIKLVIVVVVVAFSVSFHEASHAFVADKLGDPTGRSLGRITLNPMAHIDLMGTIILPTILYIMGGFLFGYAKPVPIDPYNFRNPTKGFAISAGAGPASNIVLAILGAIMIKTLAVISPEMITPRSYNSYFFQQLLTINVILAAFNFLPIPPLDGSRVFRLILPPDARRTFDGLEPYGMLIIILLYVSGLLNHLVFPLRAFIASFLEIILKL